MSGERGKDPVQLVLALYAAIRDCHIEDMLAVLDPEVVCFPLVRPGQAVYHGHNGMIKLVDYMHDLHGDYQFEVDDITERDLPKGKVKVTAQARILPEPGRGLASEVPVTTVYTVQDGLITWIDSNPRTQG